MFGYSNIENFKEKAGYEIDGIWYPRVTKIVNIKANFREIPLFTTIMPIIPLK